MRTEKVVHGDVTYWVEYGESTTTRGSDFMVVATGRLLIKRDNGEVLHGETDSYKAFGRSEKEAIEGACKRALKRLERIAEFISGEIALVPQ